MTISLKADNLCLAGEVYFPQGITQPAPALCLCHGIPAVPHDPTDRGYATLAKEFCDAGFITLFFNFRGAGQSQGNLDMLGWTQDLKSVLDFLSNLNEVDKSNICLLGSSGGAAVSIYVAAHDPRVSSVATLACPADFDFLMDKQQAESLIYQFRSIGVIREQSFPSSIDEWIEGFNTVSPIRWVDKISPRPLLLIHGDEDELVAVEHAFSLYEQAKQPKEITIIPRAGHRLRLEEKAIATALDWLKAKSRLT